MMAGPHVLSGVLHEVPEGPSFTRPVYLVCNMMALQAWPWLPDLLGELAQAGGEQVGEGCP